MTRADQGLRCRQGPQRRSTRAAGSQYQRRSTADHRSPGQGREARPGERAGAKKRPGWTGSGRQAEGSSYLNCKPWERTGDSRPEPITSLLWRLRSHFALAFHRPRHYVQVLTHVRTKLVFWKFDGKAQSFVKQASGGGYIFLCWLLYQHPAFHSHGPGRCQGWGRPRSGRGRCRGVWAVGAWLCRWLCSSLCSCACLVGSYWVCRPPSSIGNNDPPFVCPMHAHAQISSLSRNSEETNAVWLWRDGCVMRKSVRILSVSPAYACQSLASILVMQSDDLERLCRRE